MYAAICPTVLG